MVQIRRWVVLVIVIAAVLTVDQVTKALVLANLNVGESVQPIPALQDFFQITLTENRGAAFGFLPQGGDIFLIIAFIVVIVMLFVYPRLEPDQWTGRIAVGMVSGGALGNAMDRLQHGVVIDFVHLQIPGVISNVSNIADHAIVFGVLVLLVMSWRSDSRPKPTPDTSSPNEVPSRGE